MGESQLFLSGLITDRADMKDSGASDNVWRWQEVWSTKNLSECVCVFKCWSLCVRTLRTLIYVLLSCVKRETCWKATQVCTKLDTLDTRTSYRDISSPKCCSSRPYQGRAVSCVCPLGPSQAVFVQACQLVRVRGLIASPLQPANVRGDAKWKGLVKT